jgi:hypothetical protein
MSTGSEVVQRVTRALSAVAMREGRCAISAWRPASA